MSTGSQSRRKPNAGLQDVVHDEGLSRVLSCYPGVCVIYDAKRHIRFINDYGVTVSRLTRKQILGQRDEELFPDNVTRPYLSLLKRTMATRKTQRDDVKIVMPDGRIMYIEVTYIPLLDERGKIERILGLTHNVSDCRRLEQDLLRAAEQEQERVARELHDGLCQKLAAIAIKADCLAQDLKNRHVDVGRQAESLSVVITSAIVEVKDIARGLHPVHPGSDGLKVALGALVGAVREGFSVDCRIRCNGQFCVHDTETASHLYRIAQEAISNAVKHSQARSISVTLNQTGDTIRLQVRDNGKGMPADLSGCMGMGLKNMNYRAGLLGGVLKFGRNGKRGTLMSCVVPSVKSPALRSGTKSKVGK
ncbi:MAG: ATP-binding protein [bacterium]